MDNNCISFKNGTGICLVPNRITLSRDYLKNCGSDGNKITITDDGKEYECNLTPMVKNVIFNDPATIVYFEDGTKTVVKKMDGEVYNPEYGFALCLMKRAYGEDYHKLMWKYCWGGQEARRADKRKQSAQKKK